MPPTCKTCRRPDVNEINALIFSGQPLRYITDNYKIPNGSIQRHKEQCLPELFEAIRERQREGLLGKIDKLETKFLDIENEFGDNWQARIAAGAKQIDLLDKEAKLTGAYTKERENPQTWDNVVENLAKLILTQGLSTDIESARAAARESFERLEPVVSEAVN